MANDNNPISGGLVSLEGLTKPATVLVEKISDAIGTLWRPRQIVREARAEAEAEKIRAIAGIEVTEIQRRGLVRLIEQQGKQQENFENVVAQAIPELRDDAKPEEIDNDWMARFFEASKLVSDKEMQSLWARLLASEANKSGTFTKRTIDLVSNLEKREAQLFTNLCTFVWRIRDDLVPIVVDFDDDDIYEAQMINFETLRHLDDIGLISLNVLGSLTLDDMPQVQTFHYHGMSVSLQFPKTDNNNLELGHVLLTKAGQELAPISGSVGQPLFLEYMISKWIADGIKVWSPFPKTDADEDR